MPSIHTSTMLKYIPPMLSGCVARERLILPRSPSTGMLAIGIRDVAENHVHVQVLWVIQNGKRKYTVVNNKPGTKNQQ